MRPQTGRRKIEKEGRERKTVYKTAETLSEIFVLGRFQFVFGGLLLYLFGCLVAAASGLPVSVGQCAAGYVVLFFAHLSVSYSNDYFDSEGDERSKPALFSGGSGVLVRRPELGKTAKRIALALIGLSFASAVVYVLLFGFRPLFLVYVLIGNFFGWFYSAPPLRFSEKLYGNIIFALTVCLIVPGYGNFIAAGTITPEMLVLAAPLFFYGYAFTISVQVPDIDADRKNKKRNFASVFGEKKSFLAMFLLASLASLSFLLMPLFFQARLPYAKFLAISAIPLGASIYCLSAKKKKPAARALAVAASAMVFVLSSDVALFFSL